MNSKYLSWSLVLLCSVMVLSAGCRKKQGPEQDVAFAQSAEGTHARIQELRGLLAEAMERKNLEMVHDNMYYLEGLCKALAARLEGDQKQEVEQIVKDLNKIADQIDNSAGRGNQAATEANLKKLMEKLDALAAHFPAKK